MKQLEAIVSGRVQGVGFREWTRRQAEQLGLAGWVRNRADGSVELSACGDEDALRKLLAALERGPRSSQVEQIEPRWSEAEPDSSGFRVRL